MRTFETEYQLQQWREIEAQHFDEDGDAYKGQNMSASTQEQMYDLINQLDVELTRVESDEKWLIDRMDKICIESLPPHDFANWEIIKESLNRVRTGFKDRG